MWLGGTHWRRLTDVWRKGECVEARCVAWQAPATLVLEHAGRTAQVVLHKAFAKGENVPALVHEGWIMVRDPEGGLKIGKLS